jgi:hypothetical protein
MHEICAEEYNNNNKNNKVMLEVGGGRVFPLHSADDE